MRDKLLKKIIEKKYYGVLQNTNYVVSLQYIPCMFALFTGTKTPYNIAKYGNQIEIKALNTVIISYLPNE